MRSHQVRDTHWHVKGLASQATVQEALRSVKKPKGALKNRTLIFLIETSLDEKVVFTFSSRRRYPQELAASQTVLGPV